MSSRCRTRGYGFDSAGSSELLWIRQLTFGFQETQEISLFARQLLDSQEDSSSRTKLISYECERRCHFFPPIVSSLDVLMMTDDDDDNDDDANDDDDDYDDMSMLAYQLIAQL